MKNILLLLITLTHFLILGSKKTVKAQNGIPLKYISSCEIDINGDKINDFVFLFENSKGRELIVLIRDGESYNTFSFNRSIEGRYLTCHYGYEITETTAGKGKAKTGKIFKTNGTFLELSQPESSAFVLYWEKGGLKKVFISD